MEEYSHEQICYAADTGMRFGIDSACGTFTAKHWHNSLEIIMVLEGAMSISAGNGSMRLEEGGLAVINSKTIHSTACRKSCKYILLQVPYEILRKNIPDIEAISIRCLFPSGSQLNEKGKRAAGTLMDIARLYESPRDSGYLLMFNSLVYKLLYQLVTDFRAVIDPALKRQTEKSVQRLGVVMQYVRQHYSENITLEKAAGLVALNREYFARFFKRYTGLTFMDYVFAVRLENAYSEIVGTDRPITEIVEDCGFGGNYNLFLRKFREHYGCQPGEKRHQIAKD